MIRFQIPIGHPDEVARISGIAFGSPDLLYATTLRGGGFPDTPPPPNPCRLILINHNTGASASDVGVIRAGAGGQGLSIADLAIQPGTGVLYGIESREAAGGLGPPFGNLYTIDRNTGVATLVGNTGLENASLAFAPNGTLYATSAAVNPEAPFGPLIEVQVATLDPATGKSLRPCRPQCSTPHSPLMRPTDSLSAGPAVATRCSVEISSQLTL